MSYISEQLERFTALRSNFETTRDYISISHCIEPVDKIVEMFLRGFEDSHKIRLRCYKGYQMEADLRSRVMQCFPTMAYPAEEIAAFGGLVKGHPDLKFNGHWTDFKAVPLDAHLPDVKVPARVYWQMQGYMRYGGGEKSLVIYESRETGIIRDYSINTHSRIQDAIHDKLSQAVQIIRKETSKVA